MKGLELCEKFFQKIGYPALKTQFPELLPKMTVGLVGQGSECLGFDDTYSQDHDWGPSFAMWLPKELYNTYHKPLEHLYHSLSCEFSGYPPRRNGAEAQDRDGILETETFYYHFIGIKGAPQTLIDWLRAPEHAYACVSNGKLFLETNSSFEQIRRTILAYYPEDIRKKKIAARAVQMAQSGQYNFQRCIKRGENVAAFICLSEFIQSACSMIHLLNRKYVPFYKWAHHSVGTMEKLSDLSANLSTLTNLSFSVQSELIESLIEHICERILMELQTQHLTGLNNHFLASHGNEIMSTIEDAQIRSLPVLFG